MAKDAIVSEELAKKFSTEKDTPYLRWVREEGLDIVSAHYVRNLRTVELKPAGDNRLAGKVDFPIEGKLRATVTLKMGDAEIGKGRYSLDQR